jgi:hypothetical protein
MVVGRQRNGVSPIVVPTLVVMVFEPVAPSPGRRVLVTQQVRIDAGERERVRLSAAGLQTAWVPRTEAPILLLEQPLPPDV